MKQLFLVLLLFLSYTLLGNDRPNIVWITCEDISPLLSMYGDKTANTPNLDDLAARATVYTQAYATVGVCAPARSSIITGMYPISIGTMHMRTAKDVASWGNRVYKKESEAVDIDGNVVPQYSVVTPEKVKCFTEYLRQDGYFCTNNSKTDYQFAAPVTAWDQNSATAHWRNRKEGQPFFSVFNINVTHESRIWKNKDKPLTVNPKEVPLPDYFPDTETVRNDVARVYSNIELMDQELGLRIKELEEAGLLENTIIFFFSDHGGPLPRGKREHYVSGLNVPMMVSIPGQKSYFDQQMVSFVDLAPTVLSLAGVEIPEHLQGRVFVGENSSNDPKMIFGSGDRFDEFSDRSRSIITKDFVYVRNYYPNLPSYKDVAYRKNIPMMNELIEMHELGELNNNQDYYFRKEKTKEEFYVRSSDPFNLKNKIGEKKYQRQIAKLRKEMDKWLADVGDKGTIPEREFVESFWPKGIQPQTNQPVVSINKGTATIVCDTPGNSIAYLLSDQPMTPNLDSGWQLYSKPVTLNDAKYIYVLANRIGYKDCEVLEVKLEGLKEGK